MAIKLYSENILITCGCCMHDCRHKYRRKHIYIYIDDNTYKLANHTDHLLAQRAEGGAALPGELAQSLLIPARAGARFALVARLL
jgi:hypothetical protein